MKIHSFEYMNKMIKADSSRIESNTLDIAQRICYIKYNELWKENFKSFTDYCKNELKIKKARISQYDKVVYKFCQKDDNSATGYCVKSLFRDFKFAQLREMSILTEDEFIQLKINPSMSDREIRKKVKDYIKVLQGIKDIDEKPSKLVEETVEEEHSEHIRKYIEDGVFKFFDCDKCNVKDMKKTVSVDTGLRYLRNQIVKDNDNIYFVVKVPKKYLEKGD